MSEENDGPEGYGLVMPFVTVASKGGPHDDVSYAAGYAMGMLDVHLGASSTEEFEITAVSSSVPQADLLAMRYGYAMTAEPMNEFWTLLRFKLLRA